MNKKVLLIGNKPYKNLNLDGILDSFDHIYRFNFSFVGKNNGTKFGKLAMCGHVHKNFVVNQCSIHETLKVYGSELEEAFLKEWYDFFQANKNKFEKIYHQNEFKWSQWNNMLSEYGCPFRFTKMARTGYSTIFENLQKKDSEIYVACFSLMDDEIRKTMGEIDSFAQAKNNNTIPTSHNFVQESKILAWLHNNGKIDASLCMLKDTAEPSFEKKSYNTEPSDFIINLLGDLI